MKTVVRTFECATCLIDERVRTEWLPEVLMKRPDGCKLEQFKTSRHRGRSERKVLVVWTDDTLEMGVRTV